MIIDHEQLAKDLRQYIDGKINAFKLVYPTPPSSNPSVFELRKTLDRISAIEDTLKEYDLPPLGEKEIDINSYYNTTLAKYIAASLSEKDMGPIRDDIRAAVPKIADTALYKLDPTNLFLFVYDLDVTGGRGRKGFLEKAVEQFSNKRWPSPHDIDSYLEKLVNGVVEIILKKHFPDFYKTPAADKYKQVQVKVANTIELDNALEIASQLRNIAEKIEEQYNKGIKNTRFGD